MPGLNNLLKSILKYHATLRPSMVQQFEAAKEVNEPKAVMFSCMDSRVIITRLLASGVGEMFLVRNAGNLVPHSESLSYDAVTTEPGALELGCVINNIRQVMVCGHADCKAMNLLHSVREDPPKVDDTPLTLWVKKHGKRTILKYNEWTKRGENSPVTFQAETPDKLFEAYIDPEGKFSEVDRFSQINTLQQLQNIASHPIIYDKLQNNQVHLSALWLDIYDGTFHMFSREQKRFLQVGKDNYEHLIKDGESADS